MLTADGIPEADQEIRRPVDRGLRVCPEINALARCGVMSMQKTLMNTISWVVGGDFNRIDPPPMKAGKYLRRFFATAPAPQKIIRNMQGSHRSRLLRIPPEKEGCGLPPSRQGRNGVRPGLNRGADGVVLVGGDPHGVAAEGDVVDLARGVVALQPA